MTPKTTDDANTILSKYYWMQRQSTNRNVSRTTVRFLESLLRYFCWYFIIIIGRFNKVNTWFYKNKFFIYDFKFLFLYFNCLFNSHIKHFIKFITNFILFVFGFQFD